MKRIFIVDDEQLYIDILTAMLGGGDVVIKSTTNPKNAVAEIEEFNPDAIILDYFMPDRNGIDLARDIKSNDKINHIPIILISASDAASKIKNKDISHFLEKSTPACKLKSSVNIYSMIGQINKLTRGLE